MRVATWWTPAILLLIAAAVWLVLAIHDRNHKKEAADAELRQRADSEISRIRVPAGSALIYREASSNRDCNRAAATVVYSVDLPAKDICQSLYSALETKWQRNSCTERPLRFANEPPSIYAALHSSSEADGLVFSHGAYAGDARAHFMAINDYFEIDVVKLARQLGKSYFFVSVGLSGTVRPDEVPLQRIHRTVPLHLVDLVREHDR